MTLRIKEISFSNLSRKTAKVVSKDMFGVVGDTIKASIKLEWNGVFWNVNLDDNIIFTPDPTEINYPSGFSTVGLVYSEDGIFTDDVFKVGDKLAVFETATINPVEYFTILEVISPELLRFDIGGSSAFASKLTLGSSDFIGCAPDVNNLTFDYSLNSNFNGFDLDANGNGRWSVFQATTKFYTNQSKGFNKQGTFEVGTIEVPANSVNFEITIDHTFILYPFYDDGEVQPEIPDRFLGSNCLNYYYRAGLKKHDKQNERFVLSTVNNGNNGGIGQPTNSGQDVISITDLVIVDSNSDPIAPILQPDEYTATFKLVYGSMIPVLVDDTAKAWGYIERPNLEATPTFRDFYFFDSSTRRNVNFLTAPASVNDFSDYILLKSVKFETISSETIGTIVFKVTDNMPSGNLVLVCNVEADSLVTSRKSVFIGSYPITKTPPDLKITFDTTVFEKHLSIDDKISPNEELLAINRFYVELPNDVRIDSIRSRIVAQKTDGAFIQTLEQSVISTQSQPILDGEFQELETQIPKVYPRALTDTFKNIIVRRNKDLDTSTLRCFEVVTPYVFRYEFWRRFLALNGETLTADAFNPNVPFNGFSQFWANYGSRFNNLIDLTCTIEGQQFTITSGLNPSHFIEFENYTDGVITVTNDIANDNISKFGDNIIRATFADASFANQIISEMAGVMWANIKEFNGVETNARISSELLPDPTRLWSSDNLTITKPTSTQFRLEAVLNGKLVPTGTELSIWADLKRNTLQEFIFTINTANTSSGSNNNAQFALPLISTGNYNFIVDWGDNTSDVITTWDDADKLHTYSSTGTYTVKIRGQLKGWAFGNTGDRLKIIKVLRWGCFKGSRQAFRGCANLNLSEVADIMNTDITLTNGRVDASFFFERCTNLGVINYLSKWDVSKWENFYTVFALTDVNINLATWDVSNAVFGGANNAQGLHGMFADCPNQVDSGIVNVETIKELNAMFRGNTAFKQDLSVWRPLACTDMFDLLGGVANNTWRQEMLTRLYINWAKLPLQQNVEVSFGFIKYEAAAVEARTKLVTEYNWTITDGGLA